MKPPQESLGFLFADLSRLMRRAFAQRIEDSSLTLAQARVLVYVSRHEGIRQVELAALLEVQPITLARLIDHLSAEGLVERRADPSDRRAYRLYVTAAAAPHLEAIANVALAIQADILHGMNDKHVALVLTTLNKMRDRLLSLSRPDSGDPAQ